jgi:hypothetical protein
MPHSFCTGGPSAEVNRGGLQRDALIPLPLWTPALAYSTGVSAPPSAQVPGNSENYVAWPVSAAGGLSGPPWPSEG